MPLLRHLLLSCALAVTPVVVLSAADKAELKAAFDSRAAAIANAKSAGTLGETTAGLLAIPTGATADAATKATMDAENRDRQELFALLAAETGATPAVVAERYARRVYQEAAPGTWLQKKDGSWAKK